MGSYEVPTPPSSGTAVDARGIIWRHTPEDTWFPDPCGTCGSRPGGGLSWSMLLDQRGPLTDAP